MKRSLKRIAILVFAACTWLMTNTLYASAPMIMGYWENWGTYHGFSMPGSTQANEIMRGQLTGINAVTYSFFEVNTNGTLYFTDTWSDLTSKNANDVAFCVASPESCPHFKVGNEGIGNFDAFLQTKLEHRIIAIGGASHDDSFESAFKHPDQFIKSLKLLMTHFPGITGIDLDYEPVDGISAENIPLFISLIERIKKEIPTLHVSYTLIANHHNIKKLGLANWEKLASILDYVGVMGYDFHGAFDKARPITALHSSLYAEENDFSVDKAIQTLIDLKMPRSKILLGMPMYGRAVAGVTQNGLKQTFARSVKGDLDDPNCSTELGASNMCGGTTTYRELILNYPKSQTVHMHNKAIGAYTFAADRQIFASFDNKTSIIEKANYAKNNQLAGVFFWSLRSDVKVTHPESLLTAVAAVFGITTFQPEPLAKPKIYSYYAGWYPPQGALPIPDFKLDGLLLAFATLKKTGNGYVTTYSGDFNKPTNDPRKSYTVWNTWLLKYFKDGARAYVSYGGGTNDELRKYIIQADQNDLAALAKEIKQNIADNSFDGVDLDVEGWWNHSKEDNIKFATNLANLVKLLRKNLDAIQKRSKNPLCLL